jgi:hypothetical protein
MLNEVLRIAHVQRWFDTSAPFEKAVYLSQGASLWMVLTRGGRPDTFVKFSHLVSLATEAERCAMASRCHPEHAPRFVGHHAEGSMHVLASRAVQFRSVTATMTESRGDAAAVKAGLLRYFARTRALAGAESATHARWLSEVQAYFASHPLQTLAEPALRHLRLRLGEMPATHQHGDLVVNNLGLGPARELILFDWEDFGAVALPGLDLFTLEQAFEHEAELAAARGQRSTPRHMLDVAACCAAMGLAPSLYEELRLCYALVFRYIKRNYGPEIQGRLDRLIRRLAV